MFDTENEWRLISRAMNKKMMESFYSQESEGTVFYPFDRKVSGVGTKKFNNRQEYLEFLDTEESLFTWREGPDFAAISDLLKVKIVILVGDGIYLDGGKPQEIGDQYASDGSDNVIVLLLKKDSEHYFAVMNKKNLIIQKEKLSIHGDAILHR